MLTADQFKTVLRSPELRRDHSLELPEPSLKVLLGDDVQLEDFYQRWSSQGQPKYVPPAAAAAPPDSSAAAGPPMPAPPAPVAPVPVAPVPVAAAPVAPAPVAPAPVAPAPVAPAPDAPGPVAPAPVAPAPVAPAAFAPPVPIVPAAPFAAPFAAPPASSFPTSPPAPTGPGFGQGATPAFVGQNPYGQNPYGQSPYSQNPSGRPVAPQFGHAPAAYSPHMLSASRPSGIQQPGLISMIWGFGVALLGIIITVVTYETTAPGGTFFVAWGSILFGSIRGITGLVTFLRNR